MREGLAKTAVQEGREIQQLADGGQAGNEHHRGRGKVAGSAKCGEQKHHTRLFNVKQQSCL
jgi:hypothetical protein